MAEGAGRRGREISKSDFSYTFSPAYAADGTTVFTSAIQNEEAGNPSGYSLKQGQSRFAYRQDEVGGWIQDQIKLTPWFSVTPGLRYDWQNFLNSDMNNFSPRVSFAWVWKRCSRRSQNQNANSELRACISGEVQALLCKIAADV